MEKQFKSIVEIKDHEIYDKAKAYLNSLIDYATVNGYLSNPEADNEYTHEIGRIGVMCADYESMCINYKHLKVKSPLIVSIEKEMRKKELNQRQTAELLEVKENTLSQILSGKRNMSMKLAKRLYKTLNIDPKTIIEFA